MERRACHFVKSKMGSISAGVYKMQHELIRNRDGSSLSECKPKNGGCHYSWYFSQVKKVTYI